MNSLIVKFAFFTGLIALLSGGINNLESKLSKNNGDKDYPEMWKKVDELDAKGLPKSALQKVEEIYILAMAEKNGEQIIKSCLYRYRYMSYLEEDGFKNAILQLEGDINNMPGASKYFAHMVLAEMYASYLNNNYYIISQRTRLQDFTPSDIATWDENHFKAKIIKNYMIALNDGLKDVLVGKYPELIQYEGDAINKMPSVYDLFSYMAYCRFSDSPKPYWHYYESNNNFKNVNPEFCSNADIFVGLDYEKSDSTDYDYYAFVVLRDWLRFRLLQKNQLPALIYADLVRLNHYKNNSKSIKVEEAWEKSVTRLSKINKNNEVIIDINYELANYYLSKAEKYNYYDTSSYKFASYKRKAWELLNDAVKVVPDSLISAKSRNLIYSIESRNIDISSFYVTQVDKPIQLQLSYTNVNKVYLTVLQIDYDEFSKIERKYYGEEKKIKSITKNSKFIRTDSIEWTKETDFNKHAFDYFLQSLPIGHYIVLAHTGSDYNNENELLSYTNFFVSEMAYTTNNNQDGSWEICVVNGQTGAPLKNVSVEVFINKYNYLTSSYEYKKQCEILTDQSGKAIYTPPKDDYYGFWVSIKNKKDFIMINENFYSYKYGERKGYSESVRFFTDRSIYRPGQTIHFKGIAFSSTNNMPSIIKNKHTVVELYDQNYQKISSLNVTSNLFGSFSGSFEIPYGLLTGTYTLTCPNGSTSIRVEEYKRPSFELNFKPIEEEYKLGDEIKVKGDVKTYAGANLSNAKVSYTVERMVSWRGWPYFYMSIESKEVSFGDCLTDKNGEFEIKFLAEVEKDVPMLENAVFEYKVSVFVTDIAGETQSNYTSVWAATKSMFLTNNLSEIVNRNDFDTLRISAFNTNYKELNVDVNVKIIQVVDPKILLNTNLLGATDRRHYSIDDWNKVKSDIEFSNETNNNLWKNGKVVFETTITTKKNDKIFVGNEFKKLDPGLYRIVLSSKDKYGNKVEQLNQFTLYASNNKSMPYTTPSLFIQENIYVQPGEKAVFYVGSSYNNVKYLFEIEHQDKTSHSEWRTLNNELQRIEIPIEEKHRGGFNVHFMFIKNGRIYDQSFFVTVPWSNKELKLKLETFRNKLLPGGTEEWKLKIRDNNDAIVLAEVLAGMYDASLDVFAANSWYLNLYPQYYSFKYWSKSYLSTKKSNSIYRHPYKYYREQNSYMSFNYFGLLSIYGGMYDNVVAKDRRMTLSAGAPKGYFAYDNIEEAEAIPVSYQGGEKIDSDKKTEYSEIGATGEAMQAQQVNQTVNIRKNFNETAFFYPHLVTDSAGYVSIKFTVPESLTKWNLMILAHTADLKIGNLTESVVTAKELMLMPNAPRFVRENDNLKFSVKIDNLLENAVNGVSNIQFFDAFTMKDITSEILLNDKAKKDFTIDKSGNTNITWNIKIPLGLSGIIYRVTAQTDNHSDGEEKYLPVLPNRMLVTESMPLPVRGGQSKKFSFKRFKESNKSNTLSHYKLSLEFTSNPAWYAVQALPYLAEYPYECAEQTFSRYYANSLASFIANSDPQIKRVFDLWRSMPESDALTSNLEKNQDLKALLLEETPWVRQAQNETERKHRIALLFDINQMQNQTSLTLNKLEKMQVANGAWPWFEGMPEDVYVTQYIVGGIGHLDKLGVVNLKSNNQLERMAKKAIYFIDKNLVKDYNDLKKYYKNTDMSSYQPGYRQIQYLYVRSFFYNYYPIDTQTQEAFNFYLTQAEKYWLKQSYYMQAMLSLSFNRYGKTKTAKDIIASLKEFSLHSEEMGMYWKLNSGWYWYQLPIETQALLIEAFDEVAHDSASVEEMQIWLLKQKQTQDWKTTTATANAIYALLLTGTNLLANDNDVIINIGSETINTSNNNLIKTEPGTGYFQKIWTGSDIKTEMADVTVVKKGKGIAWGALYWQYFENLDKITSFEETGLKINKMLFVEKRQNGIKVMSPVSDKNTLSVGDIVKVRIEIRVDRDMEYVHLKDMRAACFEPTEVFSGYNWSGGIGYYQSIRDASMNFFISQLSKGTYVFEYSLIVSQKGEFSNGITTMQCMYAPEFTTHSEGIRVRVE